MSNSLSKQKKLVPISEAAKVLGVSIDTIRRWDKSGVIHSERPDGKNRYFSLDELEEYKLKSPLSISEVAKNLNISATTLRRLEARGLIKPKRNNAGERVYDEDLLKNFLNSDYFLRKKQIKEKFPEPSKEEKGLIEDLALKDETEHLDRKNLANNEDLPKEPNLKVRSRIPQFWAISAMGFVFLVSFSLWNINVSSASTSSPSQAPAVLSETITAPSPTPQTNPLEIIEASQTAEVEPEAKPETLRVTISDGSSFVNIRQKPSLNSEKIGKANESDTFEFTSLEAGWYEIRLTDGQIGYISAKYAVKEEVD